MKRKNRGRILLNGLLSASLILSMPAVTYAASAGESEETETIEEDENSSADTLESEDKQTEEIKNETLEESADEISAEEANGSIAETSDEDTDISAENSETIQNTTESCDSAEAVKEFDMGNGVTLKVPDNDAIDISKNISTQIGLYQFANPNESSDETLNGTSALPSAYTLDPDTASGFTHNVTCSSTKKVTSIKNQQETGLCWVFAGIASAESSVLQSDGTVSASSVDFSEIQAAYYTYNRKGNTKGCEGDTATMKDFLLYGGNDTLLTASLSMWNGVTDEETASFEKRYDSSLLTQLENSELSSTKDTYHLKDATVYEMASQNKEAVKEAVMNDGAVTISLYWNESYLNYSTAAFYNNERTDYNHTVVIVGWDDDYDVSNFRSDRRPDKNGAWLIKNSYGSDSGKSGYYWVSYYDYSLDNVNAQGTCYEVESTETYDHNYQYDGGTNFGTIYGYDRTEAWMANVFTAEGEESLEAVSTWFTQDDMDYTVTIYTGCEEGNPASGEKVLEMSGNQEHVGYHTIALNQNINLKSGQKFSVVFKLGGTNIVQLPMEWTLIAADEKSYTSTVHADAGESFYSFDGKDWGDMATDFVQEDANVSGANLRIKAFTKDRATVKGISLDTTKVDLTVGESFKLNATITPENAVDKKITWTSDAESVAIVDASGNVTAKGAGTATITAQTENGKYTATCEVTVKVPVEGISLSETEKEMSLNESFKLKATVTPDAALNKNVIWTSSNEEIAKVDSFGMVTARSLGEATITAQTEDGGYTASCKIQVYRQTGRIFSSIAGYNRYATAVNIAKAAYPEGAETIILVKGNDFPDALAANSYAGVLNAPILLNRLDTLDANIRLLLEENWSGVVKNVIILGDGMSEDVTETLEKVYGLKVKKIAGKNRFETALKIAEETVKIQKTDTVMIATGLSAADATSASSWSYAYGYPILLADRTLNLRQGSIDFIKKNGIKHVILLGDAKVVSDACACGLDKVRLGGKNRFETSLKIAQYFVNKKGGTLTDNVGFAHGGDAHFPDALAGGQLLAKYNAPIILVSTSDEIIPDFIKRNIAGSPSAHSTFYFLGYAAKGKAKNVEDDVYIKITEAITSKG